MKRLILLLTLASLFSVLAACGGAPAATATLPIAPTKENTFVSPLSPLSPLSSKPGIPLSSGRSVSALASYQAAEAEALKWHKEAYFIGIEPSFVMERNLPYLPAKAGWFFKFGRAGDPVEYYVQVSDGVISGSTEAQPIRFDNNAPVKLNFNTIKLDSTAVRDLYTKTLTDGKLYEDNIDYSLSYDSNLKKPVWYIYDLSIGEKAIFAVDATNGQVMTIQ